MLAENQIFLVVSKNCLAAKANDGRLAFPANAEIVDRNHDIDNEPPDFVIRFLRDLAVDEEILFSYGKFFWRKQRPAPAAAVPSTDVGGTSSSLVAQFKALFEKTAVAASSSRKDLAPLQSHFMEIVNVLTGGVGKRRGDPRCVGEPKAKRIAVLNARIKALEACRSFQIAELQRLKAVVKPQRKKIKVDATRAGGSQDGSGSRSGSGRGGAGAEGCKGQKPLRYAF